jgi:hypothetical protein
MTFELSSQPLQDIWTVMLTAGSPCKMEGGRIYVRTVRGLAVIALKSEIVLPWEGGVQQSLFREVNHPR